MSIGVYTEIIKELKDRLENSDKLSTAYLQLGIKPDTLQPDDLPYLALTPDATFIEEEYSSSTNQKNSKQGTLNMVLWCGYPVSRDEDNNLYEGTDGGLFSFVEDVLDALNTNTSDEANPQIQDSARSMELTVGNYVKADNIASFEVNIAITTKPFIINNRGGN